MPAKKKNFRIGIAFDTIKRIELEKIDNINYSISIYNSRIKPVVFSFPKEYRSILFPFVRQFPIKVEGDPRDSLVAHNEILRLKDEFANSRLTDGHFSNILENNISLHITPKKITYGKKSIDPSKAIGYCTHIEELEYHGVSRFEYFVRVIHPNHPEDSFLVSFTSASVFLKQGEHTHLLERINTVLFDVVSRPIVAKWFEKFANNETIEFKDCSLSRSGIYLKTRAPGTPIHWDEIITHGLGLYRWPYNNTVFFQFTNPYDLRLSMFYYLVRWLQENPDRLTALMGRTYLTR